MDIQQALEYLRYVAPEMGRLRARGDKLSDQVYRAYQHCYDHQMDLKAQENLVRLVEEYARRDINESEAATLAARFGHKNPDDPLQWPPTQHRETVAHAVRHALRRRH